MEIISKSTMTGSEYPPGTIRLDFRADHDGQEDWALFLPGDVRKNTIVYMHGSFAGADQIFTRADVREHWLARIMEGGHPLLSLNLRGTEYMSPAVTADTTAILDYCRHELGCENIVLQGGSGGASSAMAYAVMHPEKIQGVIAMGMCDILARLDFARKSSNPTLRKLAATVFTAYGGTLDEKPELFRERSVLEHADRLMNIPIVLAMGEKDALIPVAETRKVAAALSANPRFVYHEIPGGDHDSPVWIDVDLDKLELI